jgi:multidrug transporter EmrE-like cation transporter
MNNQTINILFLAFAIALNILWFFVPLAGETGFNALWHGASPIIAILVSFAPLGFAIGRLIIMIKKW